jgi:hypothetical protein
MGIGIMSIIGPIGGIHGGGVDGGGKGGAICCIC